MSNTKQEEIMPIPINLGQHLANESQLALFLVDAEGNLEWTNSSARRLLGKKKQLHLLDIQGSEIPSMTPPWGPHSLRLVHSPDSFTWVTASAEPIASEDSTGQVLLILQVEEFFDEASAREEGAKLDAICRLVGRTAHDSNNNIGVIGGYTEIIAESLTSDDPTQEFLTPIIDATTTLTNRTKNLLPLRGGRVSRPIVIELSTFLSDHRSIIAAAAGDKINLLFEIAPDAGILLIDPKQLVWLLCELASNASRAMPSGGNLTFRTELRELPGTPKELRIIVEDDGTGISEDLCEEALDGAFSTKKGLGAGLGLPTIQAIVAQHKGRLELRSSLNKGTKILITFPWNSLPEK